MHILLAHQEHVFCNHLCYLLKHDDCTIDVVDTVDNTIAYLGSGEYDCAIMDTRLADGDGLQVLKEIRDEGLMLPVMILSADANPKQEAQAFNMGADEYLSYNFDPQVFIARLNAMLRKNSFGSKPLLRFGCIQLDYTTYALRSANRSIHLVNKEFQIMEHLLLNSNRLVPTKELMENIWGYDNDEDYSVVWTCVSALRHKLRLLDANVIIKLDRGAGYHLEIRKEPFTK